jgi:hypothetical protein
MDTRKLTNINCVESNSNSVSIDVPKYDWRNCRTFIDTRTLVNLNYTESICNSFPINISQNNWKNYSTFKIYYKGVSIFRDARLYSLKDIFNRK